MNIRIGTAGWALPAAERALFDEGASNLQRYATRFDCVEINSSFYRRHRPDTWRRWADSVPEDFRFSVKLPKAITHVNRLADCHVLLDEFASDTRGLGEKFAVALVQLPPKLAFDPGVASAFLADLRSRVPARIACEPRHPSWFEADATEVLHREGVARVAADPAIVPDGSRPAGARDLAYWRLHGSPNIYRSSYAPDVLERYSREMRSLMTTADVWCIFDNTASSAATRNALDLRSALASAAGKITPAGTSRSTSR